MTTETAQPATRTPARSLSTRLPSGHPLAAVGATGKSGARDRSGVPADAFTGGTGRAVRTGRATRTATTGTTGRTAGAGRTGSARRSTMAGAPAASPAAATGTDSASADAPESFDAFADDLFGHLPRTDQRRWAHAYLLALLTTEGKKSVRRLAAAVSDSPTASQSLHQFLNASPWDWNPVRREIARRAEASGPARAWILAPAVLPKRGGHSVGVHRRFCARAGRTVSCQLAMGMFLPVGDAPAPPAASTASVAAAADCGDSAAVSVDWRLFLPPQWAGDEELLRRNRIPAAEATNPRPMWVHALDLVEAQAARTCSAPAPVVADLSEYSDSVRLIEALARQGRDFVIAVPSATALATPATPGMPGDSGARPRLLQTAPTPVRVPGSHHTYRAFAEPGQNSARPNRIWITNMAHRRMGQLVGLARLHQLPAATLRALETDFGLHDFEGRSFPGWHHHMTLSSAAHAYRALTAEQDEQTLSRVRFVS
ncbi:transposase [Streptomyces sp. WAC 06725]|uniref:transposase n=1 Tax=Streptomyces sp. WAC 06725 TaxID=2203209 RepID=UPI0021AD7227|nr:transposase [Streptomyces sp. WAC 06725]